MDTAFAVYASPYRGDAVKTNLLGTSLVAAAVSAGPFLAAPTTARIELSHPRVNLRGAAALPEVGLCEPVSLASADFDRDGETNLLVGCSNGPRGSVAVYPASSLSSERGFRPLVFETPVVPEVLATGDFDRDGVLDIAFAARSVRSLFFMTGDGAGYFRPARRVDLPGAVTALASADLYRHDGLADLAVAVDGGGAKLLILRSTLGLPRWRSEELALPSAAAAIVPGQFDEEGPLDQALACSRDVLIVRGRAAERGAGERAAISLVWQERSSRIVALAAGHFLGTPRLDLAILTADGWPRVLGRSGAGFVEAWSSDLAPHAVRPASADLSAARISSYPSDDLLILDRAGRRILVFAGSERAGRLVAVLDLGGAPVAARALRPGGRRLLDLAVLEEGPTVLSLVGSVPRSTFVVDSSGDTPDASPGDGSCDDGQGTCSLRAAIQEANGSAGGDTIEFSLGGGTPTISPLAALPAIAERVVIAGDTGGATRVEVEGSSAGAGTIGLTLGPGSGGSSVRSLVINRFGGTGLRIESDGNVVEDCYVGTDSAGGATVAGNGGDGILVIGAAAFGNTIGGSTAAARNVISGSSGSLGGAGVRIDGASDNTVAGNFIGLDATGAAAIPNRVGVSIFAIGPAAASGNTIGGTVTGPGAAPGNVLSGNGFAGVTISGSGATDNRVAGNLIGTDAAGITAVSNGAGGTGFGVEITFVAQRNTVGGSTVGARNVISGNEAFPAIFGIGVLGGGTRDNFVEGNFVGTDITGSLALPNGGGGITVFGNSLRTTVGGPATIPGAPPGNVISGNDLNAASDGIRINSSNSNTVQGNLIGTDAAGTTALGNSGSGVFIASSVSSNVIGGTVGLTVGSCTGPCNRITSNGDAGVRIDSATSVGDAVFGNSIHDNGALGIDLAPAGVTTNDLGDPDAGANNLQNFPVLDVADYDGIDTNVLGRLNSAPNQMYRIELFGSAVADTSGFGEGGFFLGSTACASDGFGDCAFAVSTGGSWTNLTATATDLDGNTSEFSAVYVNPGEASAAGDMRASRGAGTSVDLTYTPACGATDHAVYWGTAGPGTIAPPLAWTGAACGLGTGGTATFDPGATAASIYVYFVVVGQNGSREGSYGRATGAAERPEAMGFGSCDLPRSLTVACP